jgi:hypothetical protein
MHVAFIRILQISKKAKRTQPWLAKGRIDLDQQRPPCARSNSLDTLKLIWLNVEKLGLRKASFQKELSMPPTEPDVRWQSIMEAAPFNIDLELAVRDREGMHALVFPCRRILGGWANATTHKRIDLRPTHWRQWSH